MSSIAPQHRTHARMHRLPLPVPDKALETREKGVMVRFDGMMQGEIPVVFAVVAVNDLAKLPSSVLDDLEFGAKAADGRDIASPYAFFRSATNDMALYVDTEVYPDFELDVKEACMADDRPFLRAKGDLELLTGADGDIHVPAEAAFQRNGFKHVPTAQALETLAEARAKLNLTNSVKGPANDSPRPM